jgi:hypothetical protein
MSTSIVYAFGTAYNRSVGFLAGLLPELRGLIRDQLDIVYRVALRRVCRVLAREDPLGDPFPARWQWHKHELVWDFYPKRTLLTFLARCRFHLLPLRILELARLGPHVVRPTLLNHELRINWPAVQCMDGSRAVSRTPWIVAGDGEIRCSTPMQSYKTQYLDEETGHRFRDYLAAQYADEAQWPVID